MAYRTFSSSPKTAFLSFALAILESKVSLLFFPFFLEYLGTPYSVRRFSMAALTLLAAEPGD